MFDILSILATSKDKPVFLLAFFISIPFVIPQKSNQVEKLGRAVKIILCEKRYEEPIRKGFFRLICAICKNLGEGKRKKSLLIGQ